jgi:hypothetical protein
MTAPLPEVITLKNESSLQFGYDNHPIAEVNDHVGPNFHDDGNLSVAPSSKLGRDVSGG